MGDARFESGVLLHMLDLLLELIHWAYHNSANSAFMSRWWLCLVALPSDWLTMAKRFMVLAPQQPCSFSMSDRLGPVCAMSERHLWDAMLSSWITAKQRWFWVPDFVADNLLTFSKIGCLPKTIDISKLDDGEGFQATVEHHRARLSCLPDFTSKRHHSTIRVTFWIAVDGRKPWSRQELLHQEQPTPSSKPPMWHALDGLTRSQLVFCISFDRKVTPNTVTRWMRDKLHCQ